jgi:hypothetical protein
VAKGRDRPLVNKQRSHKVHMERFNLKKLGAWETIRENIKFQPKREEIIMN